MYAGRPLEEFFKALLIKFLVGHLISGLRKSWVIPGNQEGLFKLAIQLRTFFYSAIYNTATGYVLWVYLTDI
jgi:hypothetical protein